MEGLPRRVSATEVAKNKEYVPSTKAAAEFLNVSEGDFETYIQRLAGAQGHQRIWVHPLYTEQWPSSASGTLGNANLQEVQQALRKSFLNTTRSVAQNLKSSPLVVYEATEKLEGTRNLIASHLSRDPNELAGLGITFVQTEAASSALDRTHLVKSLQLGDEHDKNEAQKLIDFEKIVNEYLELSDKQTQELHTVFPQLEKGTLDSLTESENKLRLAMLLKQSREMNSAIDRYKQTRDIPRLEADQFILSLYRQIGLKSALVSGAYLEVKKDYKTQKPVLAACAGSVVDELRSAGIPTDISNNIWPPKELVEAAGFEVKQTKRSPNP